MFKQIIQRRPVKLVIELLILLLIYLAVKAYIQRDLVQGVIPPIQTTLLTEQTFDVHSYQGKPLLLHFWATWCKVCALEEDSIDAISKDHAVVTIAMDSGSNKEIAAYLRDNNLSFPVINDNSGKLARQFGVSGVPTSFIVNPGGKIEYTEVGYTTSWGLRLRLWLAQ